jgi:hypothetical protein
MKHTIFARNACDDNPLDAPLGGRGCCVGFVYNSGSDDDNSHTSDTGNISFSLSGEGNTISLSKTGVFSSRPCTKPCNLLQQTAINTYTIPLL